MKYIILNTIPQIAIPAKYGFMLGEIKFASYEWSTNLEGKVYTWDDKAKPELTLVNASEIKSLPPEAPQ